MKSKQNDLSFIPGVSADYGVSVKKTHQQDKQSVKKSIQLLEKQYSEQKLDQLINAIYPEYKKYMELKKILEKKQKQLLNKKGATKTEAQKLLNNKGATQTVAQTEAQKELSFVKKQINRLNNKIENYKKKMMTK